VAGAPARAATTDVACKQRKVTVLFWPQGHEAVPSAGFPEYLAPLAQVFKTGGWSPVSKLAEVDGEGGTGVSTVCAGSSRPKAGRIRGHVRKATAQTALRCRSRRAVRLEVVGNAGTGGSLRVWYGRALGVVAKVAPSGSAVRYAASYCRPGATPARARL
jgi:hypothetical protein